jgi:hypothetical protein
MRLVVSQLTAVYFIAAVPAPTPSTIDIIKQPSLLRQKLAGKLHDHVSVDRRSAVLQRPLLLT